MLKKSVLDLWWSANNQCIEKYFGFHYASARTLFFCFDFWFFFFLIVISFWKQQNNKTIPNVYYKKMGKTIVVFTHTFCICGLLRCLFFSIIFDIFVIKSLRSWLYGAGLLKKNGSLLPLISEFSSWWFWSILYFTHFFGYHEIRIQPDSKLIGNVALIFVFEDSKKLEM